jgi:alpha-glucosidase (family GH31 glycosyl hydrolase)
MNTAEKIFDGKNGIRVQLITDNVVRVRFARAGEFTETALSRYGFLNEPIDNKLKTTLKNSADGFVLESSKTSVEWSRKNGLSISDKKSGRSILKQTGMEIGKKTATVKFSAKKSEDWIGFGDQTRTRLYHRGTVADLYVRNVKSYIPVPFFMSTDGYGILVNTTHRIVFDMAKSVPDEFSWADDRGEVDYFILLGGSFKELLDIYTNLTGKPKLPPEWAFGLWYICRTQANDLEAVNDALNFRREEIPCDVIGLEPGWMETYYDLTTDKKWNKNLFPIPSWAPNGPHNFINAIKRMGFHFELWLANEYDLSHEEERRRGRMQMEADKSAASFHEGAEIDEHFAAPRLSDTITKKDEPWFQHLEKFVDQGADFFKQDGAYQVCTHPDRVWGNGMLDAEMHNLYPLLYSRQMHEGFSEKTGRRPVVFTPAGWAGFQAWCGTWTGDTGGRLETLGAMLNTSIVGHSWATNDMEVMQKEGIHFGYLQPWSQINSWFYFRMPWIQGDELCSMHKFYSRFRARLIPYLYSWAYHATQTGYPLMAPLTLEFPDDKACRSNLHQYLLGRDLMVGIYKNEIYLPEGKWKDYWTGEVVEGCKNITVSWPGDKGGSLYVREGGIIPFGPLMQYRKQKPLDEVELYLFPGNRESYMELYEDDGVSLKHSSGESAKTKITTYLKSRTAVVEISKTAGDYEGRPHARSWSFIIALRLKPAVVKVNGEPLPQSAWCWDSNRNELSISKLKGEKLSMEIAI